MTKSRLDRPQVDRDYEIKHAADVLIEAEGIKRDKKLMPEVRKELERRKRDIAAVKKP